MTVTTTKRRTAHHIDRRAHLILAAEPSVFEGQALSDDDLLDTRDLSRWWGYSEQWFEVGRTTGGWGPPHMCLGPKLIRYRRDACRAYLRQRARIAAGKSS